MIPEGNPLRISLIKSTKSDIFGSCYKIIRYNKNRNKVLDSIQLSDGTSTFNYYDARKEILEFHFGFSDDRLYSFKYSNTENDFDCLIITTELNIVLKELLSNMAAGNDGLSWDVIRLFCNTNFDFELNLYNTIGVNGLYPDAWKVTKVILIPKEGKDHYLPSSCRTIRLLPV